MTREYLHKLDAYAASTGARLKIAIFWARWSLWSLVSPDRFVNAKGDVIIDMPSAMKANELGGLGDRMIGTRPPLRLRLTMDPARTSAIGPDGKVTMTIGDAALYSDKTRIVDSTEQQLAWIFIQHGERPGSEAQLIIEGDRLVAIEFRWEPAEQLNAGFEMIGSLSRMFSSYFAEQTVKNLEIVQLRAPLRPGWFAPLIERGYASQALPLWSFKLQAS